MPRSRSGPSSAAPLAGAKHAAPRSALRAPLRRLHRRLRAHYGPQQWWPAGTELEMIVGAILVQNTAWTSARQALDQLAARGLLDLPALLRAPEAAIAETIRPSGSFNSKARKLKAFATLVAQEAGGDLAGLLAKPLTELRPLLLATHGFGPETADAVCLYAARHPALVVDAYTRRILERLGWIEPGLSYHALRDRLLAALPADTATYAEVHALVVIHAKRLCRKQPRCGDCPLLDLCPTGQTLTGLRRPRRRPAQPRDWSAPCRG